MILREAKVLKDRQDAWTAIEKLALQSPYVAKLSSPENVFHQSMLPKLPPISSEPTTPDSLPTTEEVKSGAEAVVRHIM